MNNDIPEGAIPQKLIEVASSRGVRVLFAVESGSRAWGLESSDSDYDIRFVFTRPLKDYLRLNPKGEVIDFAFDKNMNPCPVEGSQYDFLGFDIYKFCRMLQASNPSAIEWMMSKIHYYGERPKAFYQFLDENMKCIALYYHYKSMCKQNYLKYLKTGECVSYKKYLYAFRGLVNARWVATNGTIPPIRFEEAFERMKDKFPKNIVEDVEEVIRLKRESNEKEIVQNNPRIDNYIEESLKDNSDAPENTKRPVTTTMLDREIYKQVTG